jgi:hypothetical protein
MGRWAQYRHRGRGVGQAAAGFPLVPPAPTDWELDAPDASTFRYIIDNNPGGAPRVGYRYHEIGGAGDFGSGSFAVSESPFEVPAVLDPGDYLAAIQWLDGSDNPLSDWSDDQGITVSAPGPVAPAASATRSRKKVADIVTHPHTEAVRTAMFSAAERVLKATRKRGKRARKRRKARKGG